MLIERGVCDLLPVDAALVHRWLHLSRSGGDGEGIDDRKKYYFMLELVELQDPLALGRDVGGCPVLDGTNDSKTLKSTRLIKKVLSA